jgi:hypothetical protein
MMLCVALLIASEFMPVSLLTPTAPRAGAPGPPPLRPAMVAVMLTFVGAAALLALASLAVHRGRMQAVPA